MKKELFDLKKTLLVVDMIHGFIDQGNMKNPTAKHIIPEVKQLIEEFIKRGDDVISIQEGHQEHSKEFDYFLVHCVLGTEEAELIEELVPYEKNMKLIRKNSTCGYLTHGFQEYLDTHQNKVSEYVIVGVCSDLCVMNFAVALQNHICEYNLDSTVTVPMDAIETFDLPGHSREEYNGIASKVMKLNGIQVVPHYSVKKGGK